MKLILLRHEENEREKFTDQICFSIQSPTKNKPWLLRFRLGFSLKGYNVSFQ